MRTFLTYVLAALAAALCGTVFQAIMAANLFDRLAVNDPRVAAGAISETLVVALLSFAFLGVLGSAAWFIGVRLGRPLLRRFGGAAYVMIGVTMIAAVNVAGSLAVMAPTLSEFGIGPNTGTGGALLIEVTVRVGLIWAIAGAVWGTVFWIRAPKPTTAGIAA